MIGSTVDATDPERWTTCVAGPTAMGRVTYRSTVQRERGWSGWTVGRVNFSNDIVATTGAGWPRLRGDDSHS